MQAVDYCLEFGGKVRNFFKIKLINNFQALKIIYIYSFKKKNIVYARVISFVQDLGFTSFILEGDSANVINTLNSVEMSLSNYGHVLSSAKSMLVASSSVSFSHVRRVGNCVAHNLAKHARHVRGFTVWIENVPPHLNSVFLADHG